MVTLVERLIRLDKVFIIAEAGVNHNGNIDTAKKMIDVAYEAGVDAIKFQSFKASKLVSENAKKAEYQLKTTNSQESQYQMLKGLEIDYTQHVELKRFCEQRGITFLSSPCDVESVDMLNTLGMEIYKIPSGEITNFPLLKKIGSLKKKVILSTGMCTLSDIEGALTVLAKSGTENITVLHCNTEYPTPFKDVNLSAMITIKNAFKVEVGYSDHTNGIEIPIAAVAMGARVIEKHFTLDKSMVGPDHKASLSPDELRKMVISIRNVELAIGNGIKKPSESEYKNLDIVRKSIVANCNIKKGEIFTETNITTKRPGTGISPMHWENVLGQRAIKDFKKDELIII